MARGRGDETRDQIIGAMGAEMGEVFYALYEDLVWLNMRWKMCKQLFAGSPGRVGLLNETAGTFFFMVQSMLRNDVMLGLARLTDPARSRGGRGAGNLSLEALDRFIQEAALRQEFRGRLDLARGECRRLRLWRDKHIAHRDLEVALARRAVGLLPEVNVQHMDGALLACGEVLNLVDRHRRGITVAYEYASPGLRDGESLVYYLSRGRSFIRDRERRMLSGSLRPEDLEAEDNI